MMYAGIKEVEGGFAIEFTNRYGEHVDWFTKGDGNIKVWQRIEGAERAVEKYGWYVR